MKIKKNGNVVNLTESEVKEIDSKLVEVVFNIFDKIIKNY